MRKLCSLLIGCLLLCLAVQAQPTDQGPESFVDYYLKAWAQGDFQSTYACLSAEMKKDLSFEKHVASMMLTIKTPEGKANLLEHEIVSVNPVEGKNGPDPMRKRVVVRLKDGSEPVFMLLSEGGHWKVNGP